MRRAWEKRRKLRPKLVTETVASHWPETELKSSNTLHLLFSWLKEKGSWGMWSSLAGLGWWLLCNSNQFKSAVGWGRQWHEWLVFHRPGLCLGTHRLGHLSPSVPKTDAYDLPGWSVGLVSLEAPCFSIRENTAFPHYAGVFMLKWSNNHRFYPLLYHLLAGWHWASCFFCDSGSPGLGLWLKATASFEEYLACLLVPGLFPKLTELDFHRGA